MSKKKLYEMSSPMDQIDRKIDERAKRYASEKNMPEYWFRPIAKAQILLEHLQETVSIKMGVSVEDAERHAWEVAGGDSSEEMIKKYGASNWAFARSYLALKHVENLTRGDSPFPAISAVVQVAEALIMAMEIMVNEQRASQGAKGGRKSAAVMGEVKAYAIALARQLEPEDGWSSAPKAADGIMQDLLVFARGKGRHPSRRKVEEWLRQAGFKQVKHTR